jgi:hypothetical protein
MYSPVVVDATFFFFGFTFVGVKSLVIRVFSTLACGSRLLELWFIEGCASRFGAAWTVFSLAEISFVLAQVLAGGLFVAWLGAVFPTLGRCAGLLKLEICE